MAALHFRVLGPLEVRRDGELIAIPAPKQRALLGLLLLRANEPVPQEELIELLWGDDAPRTARASLQNQIHALRKLLGREVVERQPAGYVVHVEPGELDLERFERLVAEARRADPRERAAKLREALEWWRGPPLVEFPSEPFAQHEIGRLEEERLTALEERIDAELNLGLHAELVAELDELVRRYPLREVLWAQLMLALYRSGRQADALATYRGAHDTFVNELGLELGEGLRDLQRAMLRQDEGLGDPSWEIGATLERAAAVLPRNAHERAESLYEYGAALMQLGERRRAASTLRAAEQIAAAAGDRGIVERARLQRSYMSIFVEGTDPLEHLAVAERAARVFEELGDEAELARALGRCAWVLSGTGHADRAVGLVERAAGLASRLGDPWAEKSFRRMIALCVAGGSTPVDLAIARCEEQLAAPVWSGEEPYGVLRALAYLAGQAGRIDDARELSERDLAAIRKAGVLWHLTTAMTWAGSTEHAAGNLRAAESHLRSARAILEVEDDRSLLPDVEGELACVLVQLGDSTEARRLAQAARARAHANEFASEVFWRRALALVAAHEGRGDEATRLSDEARARADASDWLTFRGQTLEEAATVRELSGDEAGAESALREALATFAEKGNVVGVERISRRLGNGAS